MNSLFARQNKRHNSKQTLFYKIRLIQQFQVFKDIEKENSSMNVPALQIEESQNLSFSKKIDMIMAKNLQQLTLEQIRFIQKATQRTEQQCQEVLNKGGVELLIRLLNNQDLNIVYYAIHGIGNLAHHRRKFTSQIVKQAGMDRLLMIAKLNRQNRQIFQNSIWAIHNIFTDQRIDFERISEALAFICELVAQNTISDEQTLFYCLRCMWFNHDTIYQSAEERLDIIMFSDAMPNVIRLLSHHNQKINYACLSILCNFTSISNQATDYVLAHGIIEKVHPFLFSSFLNHRSAVPKIYQGITRGSKSQIDHILIYPQLFQDLLFLFKNDELAVGYQICDVFSYMVKYGDQIFGRRLFEQCSLCFYYIQFMIKCQIQKQYMYLEGILKCFFALLDGAKRLYPVGQTELFGILCNFDLKPLLQRFIALPQPLVQESAQKILDTFF